MRQLVNRHLLRQFWGIAIPYWRHEEKWKATGLLVLLVALLLGQTGFAVLFNEQTGEFTSALAAHDSERFWQAIRWCLALVAGAVPIYAFYYFVRDTLGNHWRRWLTNRFLVGYFRDRHFYELNARADIDNPDQRIAEDINTFTQRSLFFLLIFIGAALQLIAFSQVLWSIAHELVYFLVVYALAGTLLTVFVFGKPLIGLNFRQLQREADFRFSLVRVREKAEPIALYRGEPQERQQVWRRFTRAFDNFRQLIRNQLFLNLFQYAYSMLTIVLPSALIASRVLSGELEVGRAIQAAGAFAAVLSAISVVIENFEGLSRFAAGIDRLDTFFKLLSNPSAPEARRESTIASVEDTRLALDRGLSVFEGDPVLLYARAMLLERSDDVDAALADLRAILAEDPADAQALNAYGYTLAERRGDARTRIAQLVFQAVVRSQFNALVIQLGARRAAVHRHQGADSGTADHQRSACAQCGAERGHQQSGRGDALQTGR